MGDLFFEKLAHAEQVKLEAIEAGKNAERKLRMLAEMPSGQGETVRTVLSKMEEGVLPLDEMRHLDVDIIESILSLARARIFS